MTLAAGVMPEKCSRDAPASSCGLPAPIWLLRAIMGGDIYAFAA